MKTKNKVFRDTIFTILLLIKTISHLASWSGSACSKLLAENVISLIVAVMVDLCITFCNFV